MNIIFIDIDGVLNNSRTFKKAKYKKQFLSHFEYDCAELEKELIENLYTIVMQNTAKIVISSSWRIYLGIEDFKLLFYSVSNKDFSEIIIDCTPCVESNIIQIVASREVEIKVWLEINKDKYDIQKYIIIDDETHDLKSLMNHVVKIDSTEGLTHKYIKTCEDRFDGDWYYDECDKSSKGSIPITFIEL